MNSKQSLLFLVIILSASVTCTPTPDFNLIEATISDVHEAFENGSLTAEELTQMYLDRIEAYDQSTKVNAITVINEEALRRARELDEEYKKTGILRPLHGIPIIAKENYNTAGLQTTAGSAALEGFEPSTDAFQIRKLKEAGTIIIAKSNMAEWAFSPMVTISSLAGETLNPYNTEHTTAGSSGGTAASVAANFAVIGLGTDTGNSIRGPSSHNALVGFRSSIGLTSREGIVPLYLRNDIGGPMGRTVEDATRIFEVIAGYDPNDPVTEYSKDKVPESYTQFLDKNALQGARIGVLRKLSDDDVHPEVAELFNQAIEDLKKLGAEIVDPFEVENFDELRQNQWCAVFEEDLNNYLSSLGDDVPVKNLDEVIATGKYAEYIKGNLEYFQNTSQEQTDTVCGNPFTDTRRIAYRNAIENAMDKHNVDAFIYPSWNHPPAKVGDFDGYKGDNSQVIAPHTGQPAFTVPMGYTSGNLPAGLQFVARIFEDHKLVSFLYAYEQGTLHRKAPASFPDLTKD